MKQRFCTAFILLEVFTFGIIVSLSGCASMNIQHTAMVPDAFEVTISHHPYSVNVVATGFQKKTPIGDLKISDELFMQALEESIIKSQVFSLIAQEKEADYQVSVAIVSLSESPGPPFDFTVDMEAGWMLKQSDTGAVLWRGSVRSSHTATYRNAIEGVVQKNIKQGISRISHLKL